LAINVSDPKVGKTVLPTDIHITGPLAECDHRRIRFEQNPLLEQAAPVERQPSRQLRTKAFEAVRATRSHKRDRLCDVQRIFHKIKSLQTGFEV
jgi:hypothetical protein